ncbi:hypothetical protein TWF970_002965 [Orbilia oligospora]|uniref:Uncharacterized protein n=1 Tax=Orbilia oligospora TaxID=2813651 RepID=A0A7C8R9E8_ORBOL|nr:hypothetical protein TWF970_002965 [Orbilia oligospora]
MPGLGTGFRYNEVGDVVRLDPNDPHSLVKELRRRGLAGVIVWPTETFVIGGLGQLYLIEEDDIPLSIVRDAAWSVAVYPASQARKVALYVGCEDLRKLAFNHRCPAFLGGNPGVDIDTSLAPSPYKEKATPQEKVEDLEWFDPTIVNSTGDSR